MALLHRVDKPTLPPQDYRMMTINEKLTLSSNLHIFTSDDVFRQEAELCARTGAEFVA
jgi:hypothetical protein